MKTKAQAKKLFNEFKEYIDKRIYTDAAKVDIELSYDETSKLGGLRVYPAEGNSAIHVVEEICNFCNYHYLGWYITYSKSKGLPYAYIMM